MNTRLSKNAFIKNSVVASILIIAGSTFAGTNDTPSLNQADSLTACTQALSQNLPKATLVRLAKQLERMLIDLQKSQTSEQKNEIRNKALKMAVDLNEKGQLKSVINEMVILANKSGKLPMHIDDAAQLSALANQLYGMIDFKLIDHGLMKASAGKKYVTWQKLDDTFQKLLNDAGDFKDLKSAAFMNSYAKLTHSALRQGNVSKPLINGPASFVEQNRIIDNAKYEINYLTWALYDDKTGADTVDHLIRKLQVGVKVRMMVDGQTASRPGYQNELKRLKEAGAEIIYWRNTEEVKKYMGQHRKMVEVDGSVIRMGGTNPGNVYSHMGDDPTQYWRDTDVLVSGPVVSDAHNIFARLWNAQIKQHNLNYSPMHYSRALSADRIGHEAMALIDHSPDKTIIDNALLGIVFAIRNAKTSIDIENAYVVANPILMNEIVSAIKRNVKVRILSNSNISVDEPIVSHPIMTTLQQLARAGAEIYLKKGPTLHSKYMVIDKFLLSIGSYNLHPRSLRLEGEILLTVFGGSTAAELQEQFERDIQPAVAEKVLDPEKMDIPKPMLNGFLELLFWDDI